MEVPQVFEAMFQQGDEKQGEWLKRPPNRDETGIIPVKFLKISEGRGKLVYVSRYCGFRNPINHEQIKKRAIKGLHNKLFSSLWKLSQEELLYLVNSYEEICTTLINNENRECKTRAAFKRVLKTLSGRHFDPNTLEFDLEKKEPRNLPPTHIQERLKEYRLNPEKSGHLSRSAQDELELSVRAYNLLNEHDIQTFGELVHVREFLRAGKLEGLGRKTQLELQKIIDYIIEHSK